MYEALEALPENVVGELIDGQLHVHPRPAMRHGVVASNLVADVVNPFSRGRGGPGGWRIILEPELHFERNAEVLVPDIAGWRRERLPGLSDDHRIEVVPDWVCEVLSPSTRSKDREVKMPVYARYGVAYAWLVDPVARTLEAFERDGDGWRATATFADAQEIAAPPFDAVAIPAPWS
jgi:Uma2 family endonuclease